MSDEIVAKIVEPGRDVFDETDNANFSFNSELPTHSIYRIVEIPKPLGRSSVEFNHGLDFIPKVWVFIEDSDGDGDFYRRVPLQIDLGLNIENVDYYITDEKIVIETSRTDNSYTLKVVIFTRSPNP